MIEKISENEQYFIKYISIFAGSDGIVNENIQNRFINEIDKVKCFMDFEAMEIFILKHIHY